MDSGFYTQETDPAEIPVQGRMLQEQDLGEAAG